MTKNTDKLAEETDKLVDWLARYVEQSAAGRQLELFQFPGVEDDAGKRLEIYGKELDRLLEKRQWHGDKWASVAKILSSFRLTDQRSLHDYFQDIGIETDPGKAIHSDWQKVFEDFCLAFLKEAQAIEGRHVQRH
ncbi:MAG: hypothetical protein OXU44_03710 [Gammaproteobacteria bacterium]|nr:hypothetical protein [Gammaproteobacteria bacterium]